MNFQNICSFIKSCKKNSGLGYTTIGGLVFGLLGREPKVGDSIQLGNVSFAVEELEGKRIKSVKLRRESYNR